MKVSIVGAGYVGLVTGACFAEKGHQVVCIDVDPGKVDQINRAVPPIHEKGLGDLLKRNAGSRLTASTDMAGSIANTDLTFIAVGTPFDGKEIDLTYIRKVATQIGEALKRKPSFHVVVVKSTVVPGTTDSVVLPLVEQASGKKAGIDFGIGMNPEFLTEGEAIEDFMFPDRIVLGGNDPKTIAMLEELYGIFPGADIVRTNNKTAEMIKYTSNSLLATMISFSNEIGNLCSTLKDIDVADVLRGVQLSKYLSPIQPDGSRVRPPINSFLWAGCGFGGSCLPKDVKALIAHGEKAGAPMRLLDSVIKINAEQHKQLLNGLKKHFPSVQGLPVAVLGLSFRPDTDDMRESPAIPIIKELLHLGANVKAYDPAAGEQARKIFANNGVTILDELAPAIAGAKAILIVTSWDEFKTLPELLAGRSPQPLVLDGRRMLDKKRFERYEGIGL